MKKAFFIIFIFWSLSGSIFPGESPIHFRHISFDEGLSQNSINCILQDSKGFMWFGTQDGLNKYDGCKFTVYKPEPGNRSNLSHNQVNDICEDSSGMVWIGTRGGGLNRFDPRTETFYRYKVNLYSNDPGSLSSAFINTLCPDSSGDLWIGTIGGGLSRLICDGNKELFIHYRKVPRKPKNLGSNFIGSIIEDQQGVLWIGTLDHGLKKFDRNTGRFVHLRSRSGKSPDPWSLTSSIITEICEDRSGVLWIGTADG